MKHEPLTAASPWVVVWNRKYDEQARTPKPFAPVPSGGSPFCRAIEAALKWAPAAQIAPIVLRNHRPWWSKAVNALSSRHLVEQPFDRGTAPGLLLGLLRIARSNSDAQVALLCSEYHPPSASLVMQARRRLDRRTPLAVCVCRPNEVDRVVPIRTDHDWPDGIIRPGDVLVASVHALIQIFAATQPDLTERFVETLDGSSLFDEGALDRLYPFLPEVDFEAEVLRAFYRDDLRTGSTVVQGLAMS
ncbi:MAG: hypothetical protein AAF449_22245 [Myxococcota bacterium]